MAKSSMDSISVEADQAIRSLDELSILAPALSKTRPPTGPLVADLEKAPSTIFYLAYGSNLAASTFEGRRGIKPLRSINVVVPSLRLTFDLPGLAYVEPCFANSGNREGYVNDPPEQKGPSSTEYHKDRWHKGLVGVVYELTPEDYYHVIATEGGGASYKDIIVDAFPLVDGADVVPLHPSTHPIKTHTLFAPASHQSSKEHPMDNDRYIRPDGSYAQPSERYINLLRTGADEHGLPAEYKRYLAQIRSYEITTKSQRMGRMLFVAIWSPIVMAVFSLSKMFQDKRGRSPAWIVALLGVLFRAIWYSYDNIFFKAFGDGERTIGDDPDDAEISAATRLLDGPQF